jgi:6-phosphogluconate dehydrogenase
MQLGFVGLGKMGANMTERLLKYGHKVTVYNRSQDKIDAAVKLGAAGSSSLKDLSAKLNGRKVVWLMLPAGETIDQNIDELLKLLSKDDIIIDGGNSFWRDSIRRAELIQSKGLNYVDCGTSGGIWGLANGYCLMYGGKKEICDYLEPIFKSLAQENGYLYCGNNGAGHFVKMVHNGIEYGMMQAMAEGFEIMEKSPFDLNLQKISELWQHGSVVKSWLMELAALALNDDPRLNKIKGYVQDSGEGRWTVQTAIDLDVPAHVITSSLFTRFESRQDESFAMKMLAALRNQFGGHAVKTTGQG